MLENETTLLEGLADILDRRVTSIYRKVSTCPVYKGYDDEHIRLYEQVKEKMSPELIEVLEKANEADNVALGIYEDEIYLQGIRDGLALAKILSDQSIVFEQLLENERKAR